MDLFNVSFSSHVSPWLCIKIYLYTMLLIRHGPSGKEYSNGLVQLGFANPFDRKKITRRGLTASVPSMHGRIEDLK